MALSKTAKLELINPYQKFGLKRRPTFNEIVGLVSENDKLIKPFPNREATRFRNSPQGSFFDGSDNLDLLKEQQTRILHRQMREALLRRQMQQDGGTFHLQRHLDITSSSSSVIDEYGTAPQTARSHKAGVETETAMRAQTEQERREQTQQNFGQRLKENTTTFLSSFIPRKPQAFNIATETEENITQLEDFIASPQNATGGGGGSASSARQQEPPSLPAPPARYRTEIDYNNKTDFWRTRSNITERDIKFQFFLRGIEVPEIKEVSHEELKRKGKGKARTYKEYLLDMIADAIEDGSWTTPIPDDFVEQQKEVWATMIGKGKTKSLSQSVAEGAKEGAKQVAKAAAVKGGEILFKKAFGI